MSCILCEQGGGLYDFKEPCCCARFLLTLPTKVIRREWLSRWREQKGERFTGRVEGIAKKLWEIRKCAV